MPPGRKDKMPIIKTIDPATKKVVKVSCDHTIGKWDNDLMSIIDLECTLPRRFDIERDMEVVYADQSAWLDKKLFYHVRFKYCPDCGKMLNFSAIKRRLIKISCIE